MFDFLEMMDNYSSRKVGRYDNDDGSIMVSTVMITDSALPYETAVAHPRFNDGEMVIVETYESEDSAKLGHERWVNAITIGPLPQELVDVSTAGAADACDALSGGDEWRIFPLQPE